MSGGGDEVVRIGFVGVGGIAGRHLGGLRRLGEERAMPVAFCDIAPGRAEAAAAEHGGTGYTSFEDMLSRETLDAVCVCTPPGVRDAPIVAAAARGLSIFCEKPPAFDAAQGRAALGAIRKAGVVSNVGFMYRWLRATDRAKELLDGRRLAMVRSVFLCGVAIERGLPDWFYLRDRSGGPLLDQAIHVLDLQRFFAGQVDEVHALAATAFNVRDAAFTIDESYTLNLRYASGVIGTHVHSWACTEAQAQVELISDRARLCIDLFADRLTGRVDGRRIDESWDGDCYLREMDVFLQAVEAGDQGLSRSPYADGLATCAVAWAGLRSVETGRPERPERFDG